MRWARLHRIKSLATGITLVILAACGSANQIGNRPDEIPLPIAETGAVFPHAKGWEEPEAHGAWIAENGSDDVCFSCHKANSDKKEDFPTCASCHTLYPHPAGWSDSASHGSEATKSGKAACATKCHGTNLNGGLSRVACDKCHSIYPHSPGWKAPEAHGSSAKGSGKDVCRGCHGKDLKGGSSKMSCYQCHSIYPHDTDWKSANAHGKFNNEQGDTACTTQCHGTDLKGGLSGVSCTSCHLVYPHKSDWMQIHGTTAKVAGPAACQGCHGNDFKTILVGKNCYSCHASYPHTDISWPTADGHAAYVQKTLGNDKTPCQLCHGSDLSGGIADVSCNGCHETNTHDDLNWTASGTASVHAKTFIAKIKSGEADACKECHGADYSEQIGGASCTASGCHPNGITHGVGWAGAAGHGKTYSASFDSTIVNFNKSNCSHCHGAPIIFEYNQTWGYLKTKSSCYSCHFAYPHYAYMRTDGPWWYVWVPAGNGLNDLAHRYYLGSTSVSVGMTQSQLFVDANGVQPPPAPYPLLANGETYDFLPALKNTCGRSTEGSCHYNGYRSINPKYGGGLRGQLLCASYCHKK